MPITTIADAEALRAAFEGRIADLHDAHTEFTGRPPVLVPATEEDVLRAIQLAAAAGRRLSVRSGGRVSTTDVSPAAGALVSMEAFNRVTVSGTKVTVGAAATVGDVATALEGTDLFLPLPDDPARSMVSAVLSKNTTPFPRSTRNHAPLRGAVVEARVVPVDGAATAVQVLDKDGFAQLGKADTTSVVTELTLDAGPWSADGADRWMLTWVTDYQAQSFGALTSLLFAEADIPRSMDLSVRVSVAAYDVTVVMVRATGHGASARAAAVALLEGALARTMGPRLDHLTADGGGNAAAHWVKSGPGRMRADEVHVRFGTSSAQPFSGPWATQFLEAVDFAVGVDANGDALAPGAYAWAELRLARTGGVDARAHLLDGGAEAAVLAEARRLLALAMPVLDTWETARRTSPRRAALRGLATPGPAAVPGFTLTASGPATGDIPLFRGRVLRKADHGGTAEYARAVDQYARSSVEAATAAARMAPAYVAFPEDVGSVEAAVNFAADRGLKVVARSGGHQYCGLSSGGDDTLLLDMKLLAAAPRLVNGTHAVVQPGVPLEVLSKFLLDNKVMIPHGECPLVRVGGHVQTGGVGHQLRSFGLALDWVRSFKMVTRDPASATPVYREREFRMPTAARTPGAPPSDDDVFRAVLGGGPGSFGVLTEVTFELVPDSAHPHSHGYSTVFSYAPSAMRAALGQMRSWVEQAAGGTLREGVDLFLTMISSDFRVFQQFRPAAILVETMALDPKDAAFVYQTIREVRRSASFRSRLFSEGAGVLMNQVSGETGISQIAHKGVRQRSTWGMPTSGHEFDLPFKKSLYLTRRAPSAGFWDAFADLLEATNSKDGLKVVFQGVVGGGAVARMGRDTTHMQRRDAAMQLVFDVFHERNATAEARAKQAQAAMKALLAHYSGGDDLRMFWGTFEDDGKSQLDMSQPAVQALYFDSPSAYAQVRAIKQYIDPADVFSTSFTVK